MKENMRSKQKTATHQRLLEVAFAKMAENGPASTSTLMIAESAGVSHGTVFAHFPTRDLLLTEVINLFGQRVAGRIHTLAAEGVGLRSVLEAHLQGLKECEGFYTGLIRESHLLPPGAQDALVMIQSAISLHLSQAFERERKSNEDLVPFHFLFNLWVGLIHHYLLNAERFAPGESVIGRCGQELIANYLAIVSGKF